MSTPTHISTHIPTHISTPISAADAAALTCGDIVSLSGVIYTARDAAHARLADILDSGGELPVDLADQVIYYAGPTPARPSRAIGSCGPTTSGRMDPWTPRLLRECGLRAMIGKGPRSAEVTRAIVECGAVYLASVGGAAALIAESVRACDVIAWPELGPESLRRLVVEDYPCMVAIDSTGTSIYEEGPAAWRRPPRDAAAPDAAYDESAYDESAYDESAYDESAYDESAYDDSLPAGSPRDAAAL